MPTITLDTWIEAPVDVVFDLARSIDLHKYSVMDTQEEAIAGVKAGLIGLGETVTWRARHFGRYRTLQVKISKMERPHHFTDVMLKGDFKSMKHQHFFQAQHNGTLMRDVFRFEAPYGWLGRLVAALLLKRYMRGFLRQRNRALKEIAESGELTKFLAR